MLTLKTRSSVRTTIQVVRRADDLTIAYVVDPMGWMKQVFNPEYDWIFRTKAQPNVKNGLTTPDGKPDPSFYWSR